VRARKITSRVFLWNVISADVPFSERKTDERPEWIKLLCLSSDRDGREISRRHRIGRIAVRRVYARLTFGDSHAARADICLHCKSQPVLAYSTRLKNE